MALILEVLDPDTGIVRLRRPLAEDALTVGRGYANDIIVDDPYVDAHHARLRRDETGTLVLEDLGSVNGLVAGDGSRQSRVVVRADTTVRIGRTSLQFRDAGAPLPPALPLPLPIGGFLPVPRWARGIGGLLGVTALATGVVVVAVWLGDYGKETGTSVVGAGLGFLAIAAVWAGIWAIAGRVVIHRFRFLAHLAVTSVITLAVVAYSTAAGWGVFLFPDSPLATPLGVTVLLVLVAALVSAHLGLASRLSRRRRWTAGVVTSGVLLLIGLTVTWADEGQFSDVPTFAATIEPWPVAWLPTVRVEKAVELEHDLRVKVDALAARHTP